MVKKHFLIILVLIIGALWISLSKQQKANKDLAVISLEGKTVRLLVADEPEEWTKGLMDKKELKGASGMIFIFPDRSVRTFWNKNTHLSLKLFWLDGNTVVGKSDLPSIDKSEKIVTVTSPSKVTKVIELVR